MSHSLGVRARATHDKETFGKDYFDRAPLRSSKQLTQSAYSNLVLSWLERCAPELLDGRSRHALEIGCGYGYATELIAGLGYETVGTDISTHAIERARAEVQGQGTSFEQWDATTPWPGATPFHLIAAFEVVEHLADPGAAIAHWCSLLDTGGALLLTTPNRLGPAGRYWTDPTHLNVLTPRRWRTIITAAGSWRRLLVQSAQFVPFVWRWDGVMRFVPLPSVGANLRILAVKH